MSPAVRKAACSWRVLVVLVLLGVVALQVLLNGYVHIAGTGRPRWPYGGSSRLVREGMSRDVWEAATGGDSEGDATVLRKNGRSTTNSRTDSLHSSQPDIPPGSSYRTTAGRNGSMTAGNDLVTISRGPSSTLLNITSILTLPIGRGERADDGWDRILNDTILREMFELSRALGLPVERRKHNSDVIKTVLTFLQEKRPRLANASMDLVRLRGEHDVLVQEKPKELCPLVPPHLVGPLIVDVKSVSKFRDIAKKNPDVRPGGRWNPPYCKSRHKVAIIVPYRDREQHLRIFLKHMHPLLKRQQLDYGIYIVEQYGQPKFNRAMLFNIGFKEALKEYDYDCFIFHDVDLIPEDDRNIYSCPDTPKHMSVAVDEMNYRLPYEGIFGGICALSTVHFQRVNGFSNSFWGWGGEDDDMANRLTAHSLYVMRPPAELARYKMIPHRKAKPSPDRHQKLSSGPDRYGTDGLNSLEYELLALSHQPLFTYIAAKLERTVDPTEESWIPAWLLSNSAKSFQDMWKKGWFKRKPVDNDTLSRYQKNWSDRKHHNKLKQTDSRRSRYVISNVTREEDIRKFIRRDGTFARSTQSQTKRRGQAARKTNQQDPHVEAGSYRKRSNVQNSSMQQADQTLHKTPVLDSVGKSQIPQSWRDDDQRPNGTPDRKVKKQADGRKYRPKSQQNGQPQTWHRVNKYNQRSG
ncbi:uncharacterized protein [Branchiostoma lanceolatum]|uniref:uncharacterized protein n=1 Tax=Branchiostoma lanceolatum TaxID=7740 RepID=UPI0034513738